MVQPNYTTNFLEKVAAEEEAEPERTTTTAVPLPRWPWKDLVGPWKDPGRTCSPAAAQGRLALGKQSRCLGASFVLLMGVFLLLAPRGELANEPPTRALPPATPVAPRARRRLPRRRRTDRTRPATQMGSCALPTMLQPLNIDRPIGERVGGAPGRR